jgi:phenylacetic acid degradation operon negative regulatory protein
MTLVNGAVAFGGPHARTARGARQAFRKFDQLQDITDAQLRRSIYHAIGKKYITLTKRVTSVTIQLTVGGKRIAGRAALELLRPAVPLHWDEKWRVVLFDIPEKFKKSRDGFAASLKRIGFTQIQKSVFAFPYPCFEELAVLMDFHQVRDFVTCMLVEQIERSRSLEKVYRLSKISKTGK